MGRGDWQLIPWLCSRVRNANGKSVINPIKAISKWMIIDNMRRSLLSPAIFLALMLGMTILPGPVWLWVGLAILTLSFPLLWMWREIFLLPAGGSMSGKNFRYAV